jgi:hypothetical protein
MFTLSSTDLNIPRKPDQEIHIPIQIQTSNEKVTHDIAASCDDDGHIFVYDSHPNNYHEESAGKFKIIFSSIDSSIFSLLFFQLSYQEKLNVFNNGYQHAKRKKKYHPQNRLVPIINIKCVVLESHPIDIQVYHLNVIMQKLPHHQPTLNTSQLVIEVV